MLIEILSVTLPSGFVTRSKVISKLCALSLLGEYVVLLCILNQVIGSGLDR